MLGDVGNPGQGQKTRAGLSSSGEQGLRYALLRHEQDVLLLSNGVSCKIIVVFVDWALTFQFWFINMMIQLQNSLG